MRHCNHVWRDTTMPHPKTTTQELQASVDKSGAAGWWIHDGEESLADDLLRAGTVYICTCGDALFSKQKESN